MFNKHIHRVIQFSRFVRQPCYSVDRDL